MEHLTNEVREIKTNLKKMGDKMKAAPEDFKQQMEEFLKVHCYTYYMLYVLCKVFSLSLARPRFSLYLVLSLPMFYYFT